MPYKDLISVFWISNPGRVSFRKFSRGNIEKIVLQVCEVTDIFAIYTRIVLYILVILFFFLHSKIFARNLWVASVPGNMLLINIVTKLFLCYRARYSSGILNLLSIIHCMKTVWIWSFSGLCFPTFRLTTGIYRVNSHSVQMLENTNQKNSAFRHLLCSVFPYPTINTLNHDLISKAFNAGKMKQWLN